MAQLVTGAAALALPDLPTSAVSVYDVLDLIRRAYVRHQRVAVQLRPLRPPLDVEKRHLHIYTHINIHTYIHAWKTRKEERGENITKMLRENIASPGPGDTIYIHGESKLIPI